MAEDKTQPQPEVRIIGQFVRDSSFENVMSQQGGGDDTQPNVQVQVTVDARKLQAEHRLSLIHI